MGLPNAHLESFGSAAPAAGDASAKFYLAAYEGAPPVGIGVTKEYIQSQTGTAVPDSPAPPGVDQGSWAQIIQMANAGVDKSDPQHVHFSTAAENKANNNAQPDYILGADGILRPNSAKTTPPSADGKINIQVGDGNVNSEAATKAAQQLQVAAVQEQIAYWQKAHPGDSNIPDYLKGELNTAQTAGGTGLNPVSEAAFNNLKFPEVADPTQAPQITDPTAQTPPGADQPPPASGNPDTGYQGGTAPGGTTTGGNPTGGFEGRGGFDGGGYYKGHGDPSDGTVWTGGHATGGEPIGPGEQAKAKDIYDYLLEKQFTPAQASGILGNIQAESSFNTGEHNDAEGAIGLCQWEGPRRVALEAFAREENKPVTDLHVQLDFMMHEFQTSESGAYAAVKAAQTPEQAAAAFQHDFERSKSLGQRPANARHIYAMLNKGPENAATV